MSRRRDRPTRAPSPSPAAGSSLTTSSIVTRLDRLFHRIGDRLLSQDRLRLLTWLATLSTLAVNAATMPSLYDAVVPIALVVSVLQSGALVWSLTRPRFAVGVATVATAVTTLLTADGHGFPWPVPVTTLVTLSLTVFLLALHDRWPTPVAGALLPVAAAALAAASWSGSWASLATNLLTAVSVLALVATFGILVRQWQLSRAELLEQQEIIASEQERRLLMEERNRIARELHDVVAHGLSVISIQASTLQYRIPDVSPAVIAEMDDITDSSRRALVEMRGLLSVLRQEDAERELAPQPDMSAIPALITSTLRSAETVRLSVTGDLDDPRVSEATSLSVYRIVQEALSNALRHSPGSAIDVGIVVAEGQVEVEVLNTPPTSAPLPSSGDGFGLRGMHERATFLQGRLSAEPTPSGGFAVRARLPWQHSAAEDEKIPGS